MSRRQRRQIIIVAVLLVLLLLLIGYFAFYKQTRKLSFELVDTSAQSLPVPEFLFSFSGQGGDRLQRPIDVLVDDGSVYVTDSVRSRIFRFDEDGNPKGSFGESETVNPLYLAKNPVDGNLYVTDRRRYTILVYTPEGEFVEEFDPDLPEEELPTFDTKGVVWQPIGIGFAKDGTMLVTEILKGHRMLIFDPQGKFVRSVGDAGIVVDPEVAPELFQFPNGIMVVGDEVYVADSNNQRVKVYSPDGEYQRTIVTRGLPRGLVALDPFPGDPEDAPARFVQADTLAHDATIWTMQGEKILTFGTRGVLDGQFSYPGGVAKGKSNRIFIADTSNGRVQAWGWPLQAVGVPPIDRNALWGCLVPPLLLLLLPFLRRKRFFATTDFVRVIEAREQIETLPGRRRRWTALQEDYDTIATIQHDRVDLAKLFEAVEYSESDVKALMEKYELDEPTAILFAAATRAKVVCFEDDEMRRLAKVMELDVVDAQEYVRRFSKRVNKGN